MARQFFAPSRAPGLPRRWLLSDLLIFVPPIISAGAAMGAGDWQGTNLINEH
jgi:hypothetical protein